MGFKQYRFPLIFKKRSQLSHPSRSNKSSDFTIEQIKHARKLRSFLGIELNDIVSKDFQDFFNDLVWLHARCSFYLLYEHSVFF